MYGSKDLIYLYDSKWQAELCQLYTMCPMFSLKMSKHIDFAQGNRCMIMWKSSGRISLHCIFGKT